VLLINFSDVVPVSCRHGIVGYHDGGRSCGKRMQIEMR